MGVIIPIFSSFGILLDSRDDSQSISRGKARDSAHFLSKIAGARDPIWSRRRIYRYALDTLDYIIASKLDISKVAGTTVAIDF